MNRIADHWSSEWRTVECFAHWISTGDSAPRTPPRSAPPPSSSAHAVAASGLGAQNDTEPAG
eukprot:1569490-Alexandrium_andersonii.AAC.1